MITLPIPNSDKVQAVPYSSVQTALALLRYKNKKRDEAFEKFTQKLLKVKA